MCTVIYGEVHHVQRPLPYTVGMLHADCGCNHKALEFLQRKPYNGAATTKDLIDCQQQSKATDDMPQLKDLDILVNFRDK